MQGEKTTKNEQVKMRGTVKAAKLTGDPGCPDLLAVSVYDTKTMHFLSAADKNIKWRAKQREVYNRKEQKMRVMTFLHLNMNDDYNYGMGGTDIANEL